MNYQALDEALAYLNDEDIQVRPVYESLQDEFNLDLLLAESEQELLSELSGIVLESDDIISLNEGVRETIMQYIQKIVAGIQKAWDKFLNMFTQKELEHLNKQVKPAIDKSDNIDFTINNYKSYNFEKLTNLKLVQFDYERMKDSLNSVEDFYKNAYPQLDTAGTKNIKEAIEKFLDKKIIDKYKCTKKELLEIYNFAAVDYFKYRNGVEEDIKNLNNSNETIKNLVNQVLNSQTPVNASFEFDTASQSMYLEADTKPGDANKDAKVSFTDNSGETTNTDTSDKTKAENENRKNITKAVTTYMSGSTKILSAKMSILNKQKREAFLILNHFYASKKMNATAVAAKNKVGEIETNIAAKVDTVKGRRNKK